MSYRYCSEEDFPENILATEEDREEAVRNLAAYEEQKARNALFHQVNVRNDDTLDSRLDRVFVAPDIHDPTAEPQAYEHNNYYAVNNMEEQQYSNVQEHAYELDQISTHDAPQYDQTLAYSTNYDYESASSDSSEGEDSEDDYVASPQKKSGGRRIPFKKGKKRAPLKNLNKEATSATSRRGVKKTVSQSQAIPIQQNAESGPIDTKLTVQQINASLKTLMIPQTSFARVVLGRSQGTLSDLLRNPKPWNELKSGKDTFRRMHIFLQLPDEKKREICEMDVASAHCALGFPVPVNKTASKSPRRRIVFTDLQKRTLDAIFNETSRPSRAMQATICDHLSLDFSTVANYFMNARRRSRVHQPDGPSTSQNS